MSGCSLENKAESVQQELDNTAQSVMLNTKVNAPVAKKVPYEMSAHGVTRRDNYYWMRDDSRTDREILAHLEQENSYLETVLAPLKETREALYEELVSRIEKDDSTVPVFDNG